MKSRQLLLTFFLFLAAAVACSLFIYRYQASPQPEVKADIRPATTEKLYPETEVTFLAVGDIMLSRGVDAHMRRTDDILTPFRSMADEFNSTDFNFCNLESPISGKDEKKGKGLVFNARTGSIAGLTSHNFKVITLANNHALDQGPAGLKFTRDLLKDNDIKTLGVGDDLDQAWQPQIHTVRDVRIGFIGTSYASYNDGGVRRNELVARMEDLEKLKDTITKLKSETDYIVVTMHAGVEYTRKPHQPQIDFAHAAIDYGADLVIGHHPHWIQTMEEYQGKYIFYSLGNFIFDQGDRVDCTEGLTLKVTLKRQSNGKTALKEIKLKPVIIERYSTPRLANSVEAAKILGKINLTEDTITAKE